MALEVSDTGPGIVEAVRQIIFEPFITTKRHGTGLALCRAIADVHRGTIRAENRTPGPGAVFTVEFPAEAPSGAAAARALRPCQHRDDRSSRLPCRSSAVYRSRASVGQLGGRRRGPVRRPGVATVAPRVNRPYEVFKVKLASP